MSEEQPRALPAAPVETPDFQLGVYDHPCSVDGKVSTTQKHRQLRLMKAQQEASTIPGRHGVRGFLQAATAGDAVSIRTMLDNGLDPNTSDAKGRTALHIVSAKGLDHMVALLLKRGANPNQKDRIGNTALHLACCTQHIRVMTLLLEAGCVLSDQMRCGLSPLDFVLGRIKRLSQDESMVTDRLKVELFQIINLIRSYIMSGSYTKEGTEAREQIYRIDVLATKLKESASKEQMDDLAGVLFNISQLTINPDKTSDD